MRRALSVGLGLLLVLGATPSASAAPGDLDPSFSDDGVLLPRQAQTDVAFAPDGRVVSLTGGRSNCASESCEQARLFRYTKSGKRDPIFGGGDGQIDIPGPGPGGHFWPQDVLVQEDGRIVVSGRGGPQPVVMRFKVSGALDRSFSGNGKFRWDQSDYLPSCTGTFGDGEEMGVDSKGRIYVLNGTVGYEDCEQIYGEGFFVPWVFRLTSGGEHDTSYGGPGIARPNCQPGVSFDAWDLEVLSNGKAYVSGNHQNTPHFDVYEELGECLVRLRSNGRRDPEFSGDGIETGFPWRSIDDVEVGTGGVVFLAASPSGGGDDVVARLLDTGSLDWSRPVANSITDMELQGTKVLIMGGPNWTVRRFLPSGDPDLPFGGDGTVSTAFDGTVGDPLDGAILGKRLVVVGGADRATTLGAGAAYLLGA